MNIRLACPACEHPGRIDLPGPGTWRCPGCDHLVAVPAAAAGEPVTSCLLCGNREIYRKKDFPHWLGMTILTGACLASVVPYWLRYPSLTWTILIGSAAFDGALYLCVGDVSVCYRCGAAYRGFPATAEHRPFELSIAERYRQEKIRRAQLNK